MKAKKNYSIFLLFFCLFILPEFSLAQWEICYGVQGGYDYSGIDCICVDNDTLIAGGEEGIFYSANQGKSFYDMGFSASLYAMFFKGNFGLISRKQDNRLWRTTNKGIYWSYLSQENIKCLTYSESRNILYAGGRYIGVKYSTDIGASWHSTALDTNDVRAIAISGDTMIAATFKQGIYFSTNNGNSWAQKGLNDEIMTSLLIIGNKILVGTVQHGIYSSTNFGGTWTKIVQMEYIQTLFMNDGKLFAGTLSGAFISTDDGVSWTTCLYPGPHSSAVFAFGKCGNDIYAGTGMGVYCSTDNGINWHPTAYFTQFHYCLAAHGYNIFDGKLYNGVFLSTDNGLNWEQTAMNNKTVYSLAVSGNKIYAGTAYRGIYLSTNDGANWVQLGLNNNTVKSIKIKDNYIFAGTDTNGVFVSTNEGSSWTQTSLNNKFVNALETHNDKIFAGTSENGVFISSNNGVNWYQSTLSNCSVNALTSIGNYIFAGTTSQGFFRTTNDGISWLQMNYPTQIYSLAAKDNNLIAGCYEFICVSHDYGNSWFGKGLPYTYYASTYGLLITNDYVFAATDVFLFRRSYQNIIGIQNLSAEVPSSYLLCQNYPNPFNPSTTIKFAVPKSSEVKIAVYDLTGKELEVLVNEHMQAGTYQTTWNASKYSSGIYFYKLTSDNFTETKKMILIK